MGCTLCLPLSSLFGSPGLVFPWPTAVAGTTRSAPDNMSHRSFKSTCPSWHSPHPRWSFYGSQPHPSSEAVRHVELPAFPLPVSRVIVRSDLSNCFSDGPCLSLLILYGLLDLGLQLTVPGGSHSCSSVTLAIFNILVNLDVVHTHTPCKHTYN